eukprot:360194-Chlamydomonas_euryale.AAC.18
MHAHVHRLQLEAGYRRYNAEAASSGRSRGLFMVDLCKPGHMTACLSTFQEAIGASIDNWDASFSEMWRTSDLVDCILSYASTELVSAATVCAYVHARDECECAHAVCSSRQCEDRWCGVWGGRGPGCCCEHASTQHAALLRVGQEGMGQGTLPCLFARGTEAHVVLHVSGTRMRSRANDLSASRCPAPPAPLPLNQPDPTQSCRQTHLRSHPLTCTPGARGQAILDALRSEPRMCRQFLLLAHLYSRTDVSALTALRSTLLKPMLTAAQVRAWHGDVLGGDWREAEAWGRGLEGAWGGAVIGVCALLQQGEWEAHRGDVGACIVARPGPRHGRLRRRRVLCVVCRAERVRCSE